MITYEKYKHLLDVFGHEHDAHYVDEIGDIDDSSDLKIVSYYNKDGYWYIRCGHWTILRDFSSYEEAKEALDYILDIFDLDVLFV